VETSTITLAAWLVSILGGTAVPVLTGLATKLQATPGKKAIIGLALSALVAVLAMIANGNGTFIVAEAVTLFASTFVAHVTTYYGLWKPVGGGAAPGAKATSEIGVS
jgi:hypothetical protein